MTRKTLSVEHFAGFNKAAADTLRLEILRVLAQDAYGVLELSQIFETRQSGMSHHLKILAEAGLVTRRREGNSIFYSRSIPERNDVLGLLHQQLLQSVDQLTLTDLVKNSVIEIKAARAALSQAFFAENAEKFKAQQDLIAEFPAYGQSVVELLDKSELPATESAIEIGPGAGEFLPELANRFKAVIALDNSSVMLAKAKDTCRQHQLNNIEFVCDDTRYLLHLVGKHALADCVVMNMVLHHTPSPADIFKDVASGLSPNGLLIMTELCQHDQDWAREACGDQWLGFEPDALKHWAAMAGLAHSHSHYFALRNGFQIQLQQFMKTN